MEFISEFNKNYTSVHEFKKRFDRYLEIEAIIADINDPESSYTHTAAHN
jgi:hypothetical protein